MPIVSRQPDALHAILRYRDLFRTGQIVPATQDSPLIHTTIDLALQEKASTLARQFLDAWRASGAQQLGLLVVARGSGEVLAEIGSSDYRDSHAGAFDYTRVLRSPGSALKPFIYALALEKGAFKPTDMLTDLPEGSSGIGNADGQFLGPLLPRQALANSRNVPAVNMLRALGLQTTFRFFRDLGLHDADVPADDFGLSMAIGSLPTRLDWLVRAYGALANDGMLQDLLWAREQERVAPLRVMTLDSARMITSFLSDPLARLPSFQRYGPFEFPFPVAIKTGTSQGYRDAWAIAYSERVIVGVWVGRGDDGTMLRMTGARSAARLVHAIIAQIHGLRPGDIAEARFPTPPDRRPIEICLISGHVNAGACSQTLTEWVRPNEMPEVQPASLQNDGDVQHLQIVVTAPSRAWAKQEGYPVAEASDGAGNIHLAITAPDHNARIWRNPEQPQALNRLALKALVEPHVPQIVWYVDDQPFAVSDPDQAVFWPLQSGVHRFQIRLPYRNEISRSIRVSVE